MINIGIVGAGGMGTVHHSNYRHLDGCAVVGVVDPSPAGRERAAQWGVLAGLPPGLRQAGKGGQRLPLQH